ncbi:MAG: arginine--tRNA ligase [Myxococcota bacterium]
MQTIAEYLTARVQAAVQAIGHEDETVDACVATRDPSHGDYQSNFALRLGKKLGKAGPGPRGVAEQIVGALGDDPAIAAVAIAGPGFINFTLDDGWLAAQLAARAADPAFAPPSPGEGRTVVLDYSAPNIAKRMDVGHLRSTIIGNALDRMHRWLGWRVIADNHLGDWGTPFGLLITAWKRERDDEAYAADPVGELQRLYQWASKQKTDDPEFLDVARAETVKLQSKDPETLALWQTFVDASMDEFNGLYDRLDVTFDEVRGESAYADELQSLVEGLLAQGIATESEGAVIIEFEPSDGKGLAKQPMLIRKADGAALYGTTDLATARYRVETHKADRILILTDKRQQLHFRQVFAGARKMGLDNVDYQHVWFGTLLVDGAIPSSREGTAISLVDLLDEADRRTLAVMTDREEEPRAGALSPEEREQVARTVAMAAVKYFDLSQNPQSDINFEWDRALSLDSGSAVYLLYAHARLRSILRNGGVDGTPPAAPSTAHPTERTLAVLANRTPEVVQTAVDSCRPNLLAEHLEALAGAVGPFWNQCPVLRDDVPAKVREARLSLVHGVASALATGLGLLGIEAVERM